MGSSAPPLVTRRVPPRLRDGDPDGIRVAPVARQPGAPSLIRSHDGSSPSARFRGHRDGARATRARPGFVEELFARHHTEINAYLTRMLRDPGARRRPDPGRVRARPTARYDTLDDPAHARAWLYQIAHRVALDELRRRRIVRFLPWTGESHGSSPSAEHLAMETPPLGRAPARPRPDPGAPARRPAAGRGPRPHRPRARRRPRRQPRRGPCPPDPRSREPPAGTRRGTRRPSPDTEAARDRDATRWPKTRAGRRSGRSGGSSLSDRSGRHGQRARWASDHERARHRAAERLSLPLPADGERVAGPAPRSCAGLRVRGRRLRCTAGRAARSAGTGPAARSLGTHRDGAGSGGTPGRQRTLRGPVRVPGPRWPPGSRGSRRGGRRAEQRASAPGRARMPLGASGGRRRARRRCPACRGSPHSVLSQRWPS